MSRRPIVGEPTSGVVWNANRGALTIRVTLRGSPAHVGLHYEGRNAFEAALPMLGALEALKLEVERSATAYAIEPEAARHSILMLGGEVTGARQFNVVPNVFSFSVERHFNPEEDLDTERDRLLSAIHDSAPDDVDLDVTTLQEAGPAACAEGRALPDALGAAIERVEERTPSFEMCPGMLENRFYAAAGVDAVAYGPGLLSVSHGPDEYVEVKRLVDCAKVYATTAIELIGRRPGPDAGT